MPANETPATTKNDNSAPQGDIERKVIEDRRTRAGLPTDGPVYALAFSGGGIRSATFCLGLARRLAKNRVFTRFDYLSTVSGGGYTGAAVGRLFGSPMPKPDSGNTLTATPKDVEQGLASDESIFLWWLRSNGRFLIPAGARDLWFAFASAFRGFAATQFEVAILMLLISAWITLPHAVLVTLMHFFPVPPGLRLISAWTILLPFWVMLASTAVGLFWFARDRRAGENPATDRLAAFSGVAGLVLGIAWLYSAYPDAGKGLNVDRIEYGYIVALFGVCLLAGIPFGFVLRRAIRFWKSNPKSLPDLRNLATGLLATFLKWMGYTIVFAAYDFASWALASRLDEMLHLPTLTAGAAMSALFLAILRAMLPSLQNRINAEGTGSVDLMRIANVFGIALLLTLLLLWAVVFQLMIFFTPDTPLPVAGASQTLVKWLAFLVVILFYIHASGANIEHLNLSALHYFYRMRLTRAYVSTGNTGTDRRFKVSPLDPATAESIEGLARLTSVAEQDDPELEAYVPHKHGGPVHLVNCCINQTIDDRTGSFNADRKGIALTVSSLGVETGTRMPAESPLLEKTRLAQWITVSGAALGSGMGSNTRSGISALSFLTGMRLGYWSPNLDPSRSTTEDCGPFTKYPKYSAIERELLATFPGLNNQHWFLSDGGHFDNTGVYALLKRQPELIVLADCGADPKYLFADVENLVRKAKIDYCATIEFINPQQLQQRAPFDSDLRHLGTPETISAEPGHGYLLLARITYCPPAGQQAKTGALLIVKPRLRAASDFDIVGYADSNPDFPQQSTGDQFFDEAQWESYHGLGLQLGAALTPAFLKKVQHWARIGKTSQFVTAAAEKQDPEKELISAARQRRERAAKNIRLTVGAGLSLPVLFAVWQAYSQWHTEQQTLETRFYETYDKLSQEMTRFPREELMSLPSRTSMFIKLGSSIANQEPVTVAIGNLEQLAQSRCPLTQAYLEPKKKSWNETDACFDLRQTFVRTASPVDTITSTYWYEAKPKSNGMTTGSINAGTGPNQREPVNSTTANSKATEAKTEPVGADRLVRNCQSGDGKVPRLYVQIYDEADRALANNFIRQLSGSGVQTPEIENVVATAARKQKTPPLQWPAPTFLYHTEAEKACATELSNAFNGLPGKPGSAGGRESTARRLAAFLHGSPGIIEFWLPPRTMTLEADDR